MRTEERTHTKRHAGVEEVGEAQEVFVGLEHGAGGAGLGRARGSAASVQILLRNGASVEAQQLQGLSPAHWAAHKGHAEVLALLLEYGTPLNLKAEEGATPLHLAANRGHMSAARLLLEKGAKTDIVGCWDGVEGTAADMAKSKRHVRVAKMIRSW